MGRLTAVVYGTGCYAIFFLTFLYLIGFVGNLAVPKSIDMGPVTAPWLAIVVNLGLIGLFGLQHSVMARPEFKTWWTRWIPRSVERSTFVLVASLLLLLLFWQWRPMTAVVWQVGSDWAQALFWLVFATGFLLVLLSTFVIDHFDLFGLRQVWLNFRQSSYTHPGFKVTYFYKFVRHPLYLGFILAFWSTPHMTLGHLLFAAAMTGYLLIGIHYEERDLERFLGEDYRRYRERVPMLVPRPDRVHETVQPKRPKQVSHAH